MITKFGKRFLAQYLAGNLRFPAQDLAVGIDSTAVNASGNDTRLGFEFYRLPVTLGTIDIQTDSNGDSTYAVVYKTTLPQDVAGTITEIGLYPSSRDSINNFDSKFISDFENNLLWTDENDNSPEIVSTPTPRIGATMFKVDATASSSKEYKSKYDSFNMSGYSTNDTITLAFNQVDTNLSSIKIKFYKINYMKKALITGITGQDGAYLAEFLLNKGYEVHGIKRRTSLFNTQRIDHIYEDPHIPDRHLHLHYGDLTDSMNIIRIIKEIEPDEIYNLAAMSHVHVSFEEPEYTANADGIGTLRILETVRILGLINKTKIYQA